MAVPNENMPRRAYTSHTEGDDKMSQENNPPTTDTYPQGGGKPKYTITIEGSTLSITASGEGEVRVDISEEMPIIAKESKCFRDGQWVNCLAVSEDDFPKTA